MSRYEILRAARWSPLMPVSSRGFKRILIFTIMIGSFIGVFFLEKLNTIALNIAQEDSDLIRALIVALYGGLYLSAYVARHGRKSGESLIGSIQNFFTALPPVLGGHQLTVWLIQDLNLPAPKYLPYADVIDSSVFIIAIILLFKLSFEHLMLEVYDVMKIFSGEDTVKVTASRTTVAGIASTESEHPSHSASVQAIN